MKKREEIAKRGGEERDWGPLKCYDESCFKKGEQVCEWKLKMMPNNGCGKLYCTHHSYTKWERADIGVDKNGRYNEYEEEESYYVTCCRDCKNILDEDWNMSAKKQVKCMCWTMGIFCISMIVFIVLMIIFVA